MPQKRRYKGVVVEGDKRGRALGYPTANIEVNGAELSGIYAGRVTVKKGDAPYQAALFADPSRRVLEAHILDFSDDIYGLEIEIEVCEKLREAAHFENDEALKRAIAQDTAAVREYFRP